MPVRVSVRKMWVLSVVALAILLAGPASSRASDICLRPAQNAAAQSGVPFDVFRAIAVKETGAARSTRFKTRPLTLNIQGEAQWFATRATAMGCVQHNISSDDLGCFRPKYRWYGHGFASVADMLDPDIDAEYSARLLKPFCHETGNWQGAAGTYHSRTLAVQYRQPFAQFYAATPTEASKLVTPARKNTFTLLRMCAGHIAHGSLAPLCEGA